jgi:DNA topoisomerase-2
MAQDFVGSNNLPLLRPLGQFGTRAAGYKDPGAPRYIFTTLNHRLTNLLFPKRDEFILKYRLEDGKRYEPEYYVPILPYGLLESESMPASGWVVHTNARHIDDVIENIKARIAGAFFSAETRIKPMLFVGSKRSISFEGNCVVLEALVAFKFLSDS